MRYMANKVLIDDDDVNIEDGHDSYQVGNVQEVNGLKEKLLTIIDFCNWQLVTLGFFLCISMQVVL